MNLTLFYITFGCVVLIPVVGSFRLPRLTPDFRLLLTFFWFGALFEALEFMSSHRMNNIWASHIYHLTEYCVIVRILSLWEQDPAIKRLERVSIIVYTLLWLISKVTFEPIMTRGVTTSIVSHAVLTLLTLRLLHILMGTGRAAAFTPSEILASSGDLLFYSLITTIDQLPVKEAIVA